LALWPRSPTAKPEGEGSAPGPASRASLGLEQFSEVIKETEHPAVLDLGCVWQATVSFFTRLGCKVYTEDLFAHLDAALFHSPPTAPPLAERFLSSILQYPASSFRGIVVWDLFDYLPEELHQPLSARLYDLLEPGGALLLLTHNRQEAGPFLRFRILDAKTLELVPAALALRPERVFSNRAVLTLFSAYRSSRTFVGRDNLREFFLVK